MARNLLETAYQAAIEDGKIHGAIVSATNAHGTFTFNKTFGHRVLLSGQKKPLEPDDVLFIASSTKLITTIAALQCVEKGRLTLDGDLTSISQDLASKRVLKGWTSDDEPLLEPSAGPMTLRMLLTHSSGLSYFFMEPLTKWQQKFNPPTGKPQSVEELYNQPLGYQPGTSWAYGSGLDWTGRIVEHVTGLTLGEYMHQNIFAPLGITDAQFYPVTREDMRARMVDLNPDDPEGLGRAVFGGDGSGNKMSRGEFGGHGLFMTGTGFVKILHSLLANDGKLLKSTTVDDMFQNHLSPSAASEIDSKIGPPGTFFRMCTEGKVGYGLGGLLTLDNSEGWYGENTMTWGGGATFLWFIDRKNDLCGFTSLQAALPVDAKEMAALKKLFSHDIYHKRSQYT
ncbi:beta-lactamase [Stachybotrys elegans]|uniref:Beta-lactamase n=1 Tax=Stachybotrys elegans TaxID=80388 RepID=A0A8K0WP61_9HYPO|nr:beta-lactamase [Stachybotrys elegans]